MGREGMGGKRRGREGKGEKEGGREGKEGGRERGRERGVRSIVFSSRLRAGLARQ